MVLMGYEPGSKAYFLYDPHKRIHVSRDVVFEEEKQWYWSAVYDVSTNTRLNPCVFFRVGDEIMRVEDEAHTPPHSPASIGVTPTNEVKTHVQDWAT